MKSFIHHAARHERHPMELPPEEVTPHGWVPQNPFDWLYWQIAKHTYGVVDYVRCEDAGPGAITVVLGTWNTPIGEALEIWLKRDAPICWSVDVRCEDDNATP